MLQLKNISKVYKNKVGEDTHALRNVSLVFEDTGLVFVTGESGCGKSTLLNILGGLDTYTSGTLMVEGRDFKRFSEKDKDAFRNTYLGFIFQEYNTLGHLSVKENIALSYELKGQKVNEEDIEKALTNVGLKNFFDRYPNEISIGQKQRVSIARALVKNPRILLADEPTAAIDKRSSEQVWRLLKELSKTHLVVVTNHDHGVAERYADRIIMMEDGKVIADRDIKYEPKVITSGNVLKIPAGGSLTEENLEHINNYAKDSTRKPTYVCLYRNKNDVAILNAPAVKKIEEVEKKKETDVPTRELREKRSFNLVKSQMPQKNLAKMAFSNLAMNKTRTVFTMILTIVALVFFGMFCVLNNYNTYSAIVKASLKDNLSYMTISHVTSNKGVMEYVDSSFSDMNIKEIYKATGVTAQKVYTVDWKINFASNTDYAISGVVNISTASQLNLNLLYGEIPAIGSQGVLISDYLANLLLLQGAISNEGTLTADYRIEELVTIPGLQIKLEDGDVMLSIAGIYETDYRFYEEIENLDQHEGYAQKYEFNKNHIYNLVFAPQNFVGHQVSVMTRAVDINTIATSISGTRESNSVVYKYGDTNRTMTIFPLGENQVSKLAEGEVIVSLPVYNKLFNKNLTVADFETYSSDYAGAYQNLLKTYTENYNIEMKVNDGSNAQPRTYKVVGVSLNSNEDSYVMSMNDFIRTVEATIFPVHKLIVPLENYTESELNTLGAFLHNNNLSYVSSSSDMIDDFYYRFSVFGGTFLVVSVLLALFACVLIYNFITQTIDSRKREIGVLRAMGAGAKDVVRIYLYEGLYIILFTFISTVLSLFVAVQIVNAIVMASLEFSLVILSLNAATIFLILLIDAVIVTIATIIPTIKYAKKSPIDIIQDKKNLANS